MKAACSLKYRLIFTGLHGVISLNTAIFTAIQCFHDGGMPKNYYLLPSSFRYHYFNGRKLLNI
jgi:hypothetical protein